MGKLVCKIHQILHVKLEKACKYSCHYQLFWVAYIIFYKKLFVTFGRCVHMHHFRMKWFQNIFQHKDEPNWQRCNAWKIFTQIYFWHFRESTMEKLSAMALNYIPLVFNENSPIYQANFRFTNFIQTRLMPMLWRYCQFCWITTAKKKLMRKHLNANIRFIFLANFCCASEKASIQFSNWRMKTEQKPFEIHSSKKLNVCCLNNIATQSLHYHGHHLNGPESTKIECKPFFLLILGWRWFQCILMECMVALCLCTLICILIIWNVQIHGHMLILHVHHYISLPLVL